MLRAWNVASRFAEGCAAGISSSTKKSAARELDDVLAELGRFELDYQLGKARQLLTAIGQVVAP